MSSFVGYKIGKIQKRPSTNGEIQYVLTKCQKHVIDDSLLGKSECLKMIKNSELLKGIGVT